MILIQHTNLNSQWKRIELLPPKYINFFSFPARRTPVFHIDNVIPRMLKSHLRHLFSLLLQCILYEEFPGIQIPVIRERCEIIWLS